MRRDGRGALSGHPSVNAQADSGVAGPLAVISHRGDHPIAVRSKPDDGEVVGQRADVLNLHSRRLGHRRVIARVPPARLEIGDDDNGSAAAAEGSTGRIHGRQVPRASRSCRGGIDGRQRGRAAARRRRNEFRPIGEHHDAHIVSCRRAIHGVPRELLRASEPAGDDML